MAGLLETEHRNSVPWFDAPIPPADHDCWAQTQGSTDNLPFVQRCACGAIRLNPYRDWMEKNSRKESP